MIFVLLYIVLQKFFCLLLKGSHHEPSKQSDENRASKRAIEWQHHKKKNLVPCKAFLIRVRSSSSMGMVCWGERMSVPKKWALVLSSLALRGYIWKSFAWESFWVFFVKYEYLTEIKPVHLVHVSQGLKKFHGFPEFSRGFEINHGKIFKPWDYIATDVV